MNESNHPIECKEKDGIILEAKEKLVIAVSRYNTTLSTIKENTEKLRDGFFFYLMLLFFFSPWHETSSLAFFLFFAIYFLIACLGLFLYAWKFICAKDVSLLDDPSQAATYRYAKSSKTQSINLAPFRNAYPHENQIMSKLYDDIITEQMVSEGRDFVIKTLMEAGLRQLIVDTLFTSHVPITISSHSYYEYHTDREEEEEEDSFWEEE